MLTGKVPLDFGALYPKLYPLIAGISHGRLSDWWIFRHYGTFTQKARMYYPYNPRTETQQTWRNFFAYGVSNWQGFDSATKNFYNQLKRPKYMLGFNRYLRLYLNANYPPS
ncbi:MAG: hypothetical protein PHS93_08420 [Candidatus Omnitrophica bacterium]|nr:hypothetical protein [Candidatus Omnitrophota bacterium]MDD5353167.1 hypothetical protein [Candidatus Omnitrophota bacterium]MDD5551126.1 hypothetical protein [Candidatus Omnitrophota bacterium]